MVNRTDSTLDNYVDDILNKWNKIAKEFVKAEFNKAHEDALISILESSDIKSKVNFLYVDSPLELLLANQYLSHYGFLFDKNSHDKFFSLKSKFEDKIFTYTKHDTSMMDLVKHAKKQVVTSHYYRMTNILLEEDAVFDDGYFEENIFANPKHESIDFNVPIQRKTLLVEKIDKQLKLKDHEKSSQFFYEDLDFLQEEYFSTISDLQYAAVTEILLFNNKMPHEIQDTAKLYIEYAKAPYFAMRFIKDPSSDTLLIIISKFPKTVVATETLHPVNNKMVVVPHNTEDYAVLFSDGWGYYFILGTYFNEYQFKNFILNKISADGINKLEYLDQHDRILWTLRYYYGITSYYGATGEVFDAEKVRRWFSSKDERFWYKSSDDWVLSEEEIENRAQFKYGLI